MKTVNDYLSQIVARKRKEVERRIKRDERVQECLKRLPLDEDRGACGITALRRANHESPHVIAEIKFRSPSAGRLRERSVGQVTRIAKEYVRAGASAISVLADNPGFSGGVLDVRRVARSVDVPVLFKEFVVHRIQVDTARLAGASLVLLLENVLERHEVSSLVKHVQESGMEPVLEAATVEEVDRALETHAKIIGVNARDLRSFRVDKEAAAKCIERIPSDRVRVFMSGISSAEDYRLAADAGADAVLVGETLMRAPSPGAKLAEIAARSL